MERFRFDLWGSPSPVSPEKLFKEYSRNERRTREELKEVLGYCRWYIVCTNSVKHNGTEALITDDMHKTAVEWAKKKPHRGAHQVAVAEDHVNRPQEGGAVEDHVDRPQEGGV